MIAYSKPSTAYRTIASADEAGPTDQVESAPFICPVWDDAQQCVREMTQAEHAGYVRSRLKLHAYQHAAGMISSIISGYSPVEARDWRELAQEAQAYEQSAGVIVGGILQERAAAGIDLPSYVARVLAKASTWPPSENAVYKWRDDCVAWINGLSDAEVVTKTESDVEAFA